MEKTLSYVTQISKKDLAEIADACNIHAGEGIDITRTDQGLEVSIDRNQLQRWIELVMGGASI